MIYTSLTDGTWCYQSLPPRSLSQVYLQLYLSWCIYPAEISNQSLSYFSKVDRNNRKVYWLQMSSCTWFSNVKLLRCVTLIAKPGSIPLRNWNWLPIPIKNPELELPSLELNWNYHHSIGIWIELELPSLELNWILSWNCILQNCIRNWNPIWCPSFNQWPNTIIEG